MNVMLFSVGQMDGVKVGCLLAEIPFTDCGINKAKAVVMFRGRIISAKMVESSYQFSDGVMVTVQTNIDILFFI